MKKVYGLTGKSLSVVMMTALLLYFGAVPQDISWDKGISYSGMAVAAGKGSGQGGGHSGGGHGNGHGGGGFGNGNSRSIINYKGRDTHLEGSATGSGSTKGRGAGSQAVVEKIFNNG